MQKEEKTHILLSLMGDTSIISDSISQHSSGLPDLNRQAIDAALANNWEVALELNKKIVKLDPANADCLNRLARALFELGNFSEAKKTYQKALEIDPYNSISQKNIKRIISIKKLNRETQQKNTLHNDHSLSPNLFLEEAGITKVVSLIKLAEPDRLSRLYPGEMVNLIPKNRSVVVTDMNNNYLGVFADDISFKLLRLIKGGNKYQALIKSVRPNQLSILVRETFRARRFRNQPSFLDGSTANTYSSDHISLNYDSDNEGAETDTTEPEELLT